MRVLLVVHGFPPWATGGTELYVEELARELEAQGDEVTVLTREADPDRAEHAVRREEREGVSLCVVNNTFRACRSFAESYDNAAISDVAARLVDEVRPEVAHVHHLTCLSTGIVAELARRRIPIVFTLHDYWLMCHRGQLLDTGLEPCAGPGERCRACGGLEAGAGPAAHAGARLLRALERRTPRLAATLRSLAVAAAAPTAAGAAAAPMLERTRHMREVAAKVDLFLAPSRALAERFVAWGLPGERVHTTRLGVDPEPFARLESRASGVLRLGFAGSLMVSKAPHLLLEAHAALPPGAATVDLLGEPVAYHGDSSYAGVLAAHRGRPGVRFLGNLPHEEVPGFLAGIDVLVVPSIWPENSPCVIREAFLAGVPVVASAVGGVPEMVRDGVDGLLVPPGDVAALTAALRRLLEEPGLVERLRSGIGSVQTMAADAAVLREHYRRLALEAGRRRSRLAAVVLNYGTPGDAVLAVRSLASSRRRPDEIVVVDNASPDGSAAILRRRLPGVTLVEAGENGGFSAGCNLGIRTALAGGADLVLLQNADVIVDPDCLGRLEDALVRSPGVGLAGPLVLRRDDPAVVATAGISFSLLTGRVQSLGEGVERDRLQVPPLSEVSAVAGCAVLVRRETLEAVGLLNEDFFFAFEDVELGLRAAGAGWRSLVVSEAIAYHAVSLAIGESSPRRLYFAARNHLLLARRAAPLGPLAGTLRAAVIVGLNLAHALAGRGGPRLAGTLAVLRGVGDHVRRRYGRGGRDT